MFFKWIFRCCFLTVHISLNVIKEAWIATINMCGYQYVPRLASRWLDSMTKLRFFFFFFNHVVQCLNMFVTTLRWKISWIWQLLTLKMGRKIQPKLLFGQQIRVNVFFGDHLLKQNWIQSHDCSRLQYRKREYPGFSKVL